MLIDIDETKYNSIRKFRDLHRSDSEIVIRNGTPLSGLTNGEVIQKMFPEAEVKINGFIVDVIFEMFEFHVEESWWDRKWGETE